MQPTVTKLIKVLELEQQQGYRNEAVIGGLEAFVPRWQAEAEGEVPDRLVSAVGRLAGYGELSEAERRIRVRELISQVRAAESKVQGQSAKGAGGSDRPASAPGSARGSGERSRGSRADGSRSQGSRSGGSRSEGSRSRDSRSDDSRADGAPSKAADAAPESDPSQVSEPRMADDPELDRPVVHLRGVGSKSADNLARLGLETIRDMLYHAPIRYNDYSRLTPINRLVIGEEATVVGAVWATEVRQLKGKRTVLNLTLSDSTANIRCSFFNQPYLEREFRQGRRIVVSGRVESWSGRPTFRAPEWEPVERDLTHTGRLVPVYPLTRGVTQRWLRRQIKHVVDGRADLVGDPVPRSVREQEGLLTLPEALRELHFPKSEESLASARRRLAFDELLTLQLWSRRRRMIWRARDAVSLASGASAADEFVSSLPFELTAAQRRTLDEIAADLAEDVPMSRLLQGDVGSGKTVVAVAAIIAAVGAGQQAALMAPTEILAEQHASSLRRLLQPLGYQMFRPDEPEQDGEGGGKADRSPNIARLVGSMRPADKAATAAAAADGTVDIVVGTHAVIQDAVRFRRLGLAVIDEQHRFGVLQRASLPQRIVAGDDGTAPSPHALIMTATPIPRTLAQVLAADLDQSIIDELPPGRKPIQTRRLGTNERERAYQFIRHRVAQGEQAYIVYSLVDESESVAARAAVAEHERLSETVFPELRVGLLHGRLASSEKEEIFTAFNDGDIDVLVATSVIEVGVDVPNATVMLIDGADRFGLAQLHQFRGRVGRGAAESVCLLLADKPSGTARERLEAMTSTTDGMELARLDLEMRGPGDYFGVRQAGLMEQLRFARLSSTVVMADASRVAAQIMRADPELAAEDLAAMRVRVDVFSEAAERI